MSEFMSFSGLSGVLQAIGQVPNVAKDSIKQLYGGAAAGCYADSQDAVPVLSGDLKGSGHVDIVDTGDLFSVSVTYGDGNGYGSKYGDADGYSWFQEMGTRFMAAQPYLGPAFDVWSQKLESDLGDLFS